MEPRDFDILSRDFAEGLSRRDILRILATACAVQLFGRFWSIGTARAAQACVASNIANCIKAADDTLERELDDCVDVPNRAQCRAAARRRHDAAVKACDPCPSGTRCESDICCPNGQPTCAPPCSGRRTDTESILEYTVASAFQGKTLTLLATHTVPNPIERSPSGRTTVRPGIESARGNKTVFLGTDVLFAVDYRLMTGEAHINATFGPAFVGVHSATITVEGSRVSGDVDGRAIVPFAQVGSPKDVHLTFADGRDRPTVTIDPSTLDALKQILSQASGAARACRQSPRVFDNTNVDPGCITCENVCSDTAQELLAVATAVSVACLFEAPACLAAAEAAIQVQYDGCRRGCEGDGGPCCPIRCEVGCCDNGHTCCGTEGICCGAGQTCAGSVAGLGICCPTTSGPLCGNTCCAPGQECADQARGICCPSNMSACGEICCPKNQLCLDSGAGFFTCCAPSSKNCGDGQCCPQNGTCIGQTCCSPISRICGGVCCAPFDVCCPDTCCGGDNLCVDGHICCPRDQVCGRICCPPGQHCVNGACARCPQGTVPCSSPGPNHVIVSTCCPPGAGCCLGVCCTNQTGHECTGPGGSCGTIH